MFTGIIEEAGVIVSLTSTKDSGRIGVATLLMDASMPIGSSIAVNGCCLTVVEADREGFAADLSDETLRQTALGSYRVGDAVNLERPLRLGDRMGGHWVLGHVDGVGTIQDIVAAKGSTRFDVAIPMGLRKYIIDKGSLAMDGISLTVSLSQNNRVSVYILPHTLQVTNLGRKQVGDCVNLEVDMVGKYLENLVVIAS